MFYSEIFPRRESCQIFDKKTKRKLKFFLKFKKKKNQINKNNFLFSIKNWKQEKFSTIRKLSFPFGAFKKKSNLCLVTEKNFWKPNSKYFRKIISPKKFQFTLKNIFLKNFEYKNFSFMLDYNLKKKKYETLLKRSNINFQYIKIKKNLRHCLLESFCSLCILSPKGLTFSLQIDIKTCVKKYINNFDQIFGNFLEYLKDGLCDVNNIEIYPKNHAKFRLFFRI